MELLNLNQLEEINGGMDPEVKRATLGFLAGTGLGFGAIAGAALAAWVVIEVVDYISTP